MKVVQINATCGQGSTGMICASVSEILSKNGIENYILYCVGNGNIPNAIKYSDEKKIRISAFLSRLSGNWGFEERFITRRLISELNKLKPDIIHLHNVHSHAFNLSVFFKWAVKNKVRVFWTFHDCWAFTGNCMHFDMIGCEKWKTECEKCPLNKEFSFFADSSKTNFNRKRRLLCSLNPSIVVPSAWLGKQVKMSFLKDCDIRVINNGIDLSVFKPLESDILSSYNVGSKKIILGVSSVWNKKKGLDVFILLAQRLNSDEYVVVLVGTDEAVDKLLPPDIISIHHTRDKGELACIYSAADVFVNPTREENFPTVNIEALACGTPVVTFRTGGSPEIIDENCGSVVAKDDVDSLQNEIIRICNEKPYSSEACINRASVFDMNDCYNEYLKLYL